MEFVRNIAHSRSVADGESLPAGAQNLDVRCRNLSLPARKQFISFDLLETVDNNIFVL